MYCNNIIHKENDFDVDVLETGKVVIPETTVMKVTIVSQTIEIARKVRQEI